MLVDLTFDVNAEGGLYRREFVKDFVTEGGGLIITFSDGTRTYGPTVYTRRIAPGVYEGHLLRDAISYSPYFEYEDWGHQQEDYEALRALPDGPEREALRLRLVRRPNEFGYADSLAAVLRYGRWFVRSPYPYALQVNYPEVIGEKWHKDGEYVRPSRRRVCPEPGCVRFHFYRLKLKAPCGGVAHETVRTACGAGG